MLPHQPAQSPPSYAPRPPSSSALSPSPQPQDALARDFPTISAMSKEDLQDLLSDQAYFDAVFESLPQVRRMRESHAELIAASEALAGKSSHLQAETSADGSVAERNLATRPRLDASREQTAIAFANANASKAKWAELEARQAELYKRFSCQSAYSRLLTARHDDDRASEQIATDFVDAGAMDEDEFVRHFRELRKSVHKKGMALAKWGEISAGWDR